ncbi:MAG: hypothetical protein JXR95_01510 [Deltaproteobacteria bacterium]|nr:hypothetical protein [Deltaproteobacteria bacterium]
MKIKILPVFLTVLISTWGCDDDGSNKNPGIKTDQGLYTYVLSQSNQRQIWTTSVTNKVRMDNLPPEQTGDILKVHMARNEFEPLKIIVPPQKGSVSVSSISGLEQLDYMVQKVEFVDGWEEKLVKVSQGETINLSSSQNTVLWITFHSIESTPSGTQETVLSLDFGSGDTVDIPLEIYIFDFSLPLSPSFHTQLNVSISSLMSSGKTVEDVKTMLFEHKMTPKSVTWPSSFSYTITWDNTSNPNQCSSFYDEEDEGADYSIRYLALKYISGTGWNGVGFPTSMLFQFVDNSTPRPDTFCGVARGDHYGTEEYNQNWGEYLGSLESYLISSNYIEKTYYYVQNEPQNDEDHKLAAYLCSLVRSYAPELRIAISEEPKPEITEDPEWGCGYDIWIAHIRALNESYALERQLLGETLWLYSLDHDPEPYFNPTLIENQGIHQRIIPWVSWTLRARGWAYYDFGRFFIDGEPTVRASLFREGFEDYEYLRLANNGLEPDPGTSYEVDTAVFSAASSLTSFTRLPDALLKLRNELGFYVEGTSTEIPVLEDNTPTRPSGKYFINFQNPSGEPSDEPLTDGTNNWIKIGWQPFDSELMYGWYGEFIDNTSIALYGYDNTSGFTEFEKSYLYDDYGRDNLFEFSIENGTYEVTVCAGRPARGYPSDPHNVTIEGVKVIDDEITTDENPQFTRTVTVQITDGSLSLVCGGKSNSTGQYSYTFLSYLVIKPSI